MLTAVESDYIKNLILTYRKMGYDKYLCHTITDSSNDYDICIYFSKNGIEAVTDTYYDVTNGIKVLIDSSSKSSHNYDAYKVSVGFNGFVNIDRAEFVYTNASLIEGYAIELQGLCPDLIENTQGNHLTASIVIISVIILLYLVIRDLFKLGG